MSSYPYFKFPNNPFQSNTKLSRISNPVASNDHEPIYKTPFTFSQQHDKTLDTRAKDSMRQTFEEHKLEKLFFSDENIRRLQKMIKKRIFIETKGLFLLEADQDENDLLVAMRAVYFEHGNYRSDKLIEQVKKLNQLTLGFILPDMITEIKQGYEYLKEINRPLRPIARPVNVNTGKQSLPAITTTWV